MHGRLDVGRVAAFDRVFVMVAAGAAEADGHFHLLALGRHQFAAHLRGARGAARLEFERVDQVAEHAEQAAALEARDHRRHVLAVLPDIGLGVFARRVAAAVLAGGVDAEMEVRIGHGPDAAAFAQQRVPGAAELGHQVVDAAVGAVGQFVGRVGLGVAAAVGFHLVAHHAFDGEEDRRRQVVHLTQLADGVLAGVARRVIQQHVAVGVPVAQPLERRQRIGVGGVGARLAGQVRYQLRIEQVGGLVGVEVFELGHGAQRLLGHRVVGADADVDVIVRGHVPLERREDDLAGVAARGLCLLDERHFVARHAGRERNRSARDRQAGVVASGHAQVVRERGPVQFVAVEGLVQHAFQRGLRVVGLDGVHVQIAGAPGARADRRRGVGHDRGRRDGGGLIVVIAAATGAQQGYASQRQRHQGPPQAGYFELHSMLQRHAGRKEARRREGPHYEARG
ncbi:Uncharacterised protein [Achromobacter xylosoxidans]|nr:Uncharacterised protein [Achromobacter xylosoxidans]